MLPAWHHWPPSPSWDQAACAGKDTSVFFPTRGAPLDQARKICAGCPINLDCLDFALQCADLRGVWAGTSELERRRLRRSRRILVPGHDDSDSGHVDSALSNGNGPVRVAGRTCGLPGCDTPTEGTSRYCSPRHQRQAKEQRARARNATTTRPPPPPAREGSGPPLGLAELLAGTGVHLVVTYGGRSWLLTPTT